MNIIYIHTHDTGRYIQPYGHNLPTPNLMELARQGTLFRSAFSTAPTCSPSRAGLLTGMSPHRAGMIGLAHRGFQLNDYRQHLINFLGDRGFRTVLCGIQHVAPDREMIGYDRILDQGAEVTDDLENARRVADFLGEDHKQPFFLSFGMQNTHRPFPEIEEAINPDYIKTPFPIYENRANRQDMARFMSGLRVVDQAVGIVHRALQENNLREETLIIFTTDHGLAFPRMKCNLYDSGIGVSLIVDYPDNPLSGQAVDALVSHLDIYPFICDLLDFEPPERLEGYSLLPLFYGETDSIRDEIYGEVTYHAAYQPMRAVRTRRYKYIRRFDEPEVVPANIDDSPDKQLLVDSGYLEREQPREYLFDLYLDPVERENLVGDPDYKEVYEDLTERLEEWMKRTEDPLLTADNRVEKPEGAIVNKRSCLSPEEKDFE